MGIARLAIFVSEMKEEYNHVDVRVCVLVEGEVVEHRHIFSKSAFTDNWEGENRCLDVYFDLAKEHIRTYLLEKL